MSQKYSWPANYIYYLIHSNIYVEFSHHFCIFPDCLFNLIKFLLAIFTGSQKGNMLLILHIIISCSDKPTSFIGLRKIILSFSAGCEHNPLMTCDWLSLAHCVNDIRCNSGVLIHSTCFNVRQALARKQNRII